jgi:magnesium-transporting ATPase (P-type)
MFDFFHRAKHWLLFIPISLATLYQYGVQIAYQGEIASWQVEMQDPDVDIEALMPDLADFSSYFYLFLLFFVVSYGTHFLWYWAVGKGLERHLPEGTALKPQRFRIAMIVNAVMLLVGLYVFMGVWDTFVELFSALGAEEEPGDDFFKEFLTSIGSMFVLFFFWLLAMIYGCYYVGKTLKSIELGRPARGGEVVGYALLSYLLIIGIWMLQPKINRLVSTGSMSSADDGNAW